MATCTLFCSQCSTEYLFSTGSCSSLQAPAATLQGESLPEPTQTVFSACQLACCTLRRKSATASRLLVCSSGRAIEWERTAFREGTNVRHHSIELLYAGSTADRKAVEVQAAAVARAELRQRRQALWQAAHVCPRDVERAQQLSVAGRKPVTGVELHTTFHAELCQRQQALQDPLDVGALQTQNAHTCGAACREPGG